MEQELYKARSLSSCIKTAYDITLNNAKTIISKTWIAAIINAAITALLPIIYSPSPLGLSLTFIVSLLAVASNALLFAKLANLLNNKGLKYNIKRMLSMSFTMTLCAYITIGVLISAFLFIAKWAISSGSSTPLAYAYLAVAILTILAIILWLPASYSCMNYLYNDKNSLASIFGRPYAIGFKSWGFLFIVHFMLGMIISILFIPLFALPTTLAFADMANAASMSLGDADGIPSGFMLMYYFSTFISWLLMSYVCLWGHIAVYFAYGSITYKLSSKTSQSQNTDGNE